MTTNVNISSAPRWTLTVRSAESLAEDIGLVGTYVGPRTGSRPRTHGEKEDYVLRRLLVGWKLTNQLKFPVNVIASREDRAVPDFIVHFGDGNDLGIEVTEAGETGHQAQLTAAERAPGVRHMKEPTREPTAVTAMAITEAVRRKSALMREKGFYGRPSDCDLAVYDNTEWGGFLSTTDLLAEIRRAPNRPAGFRQVHLVKGVHVVFDIFGLMYPEPVDISKTYEADYAGWVFDQIERLRRGEVAGADVLHIAEELEDLGRSERRSLRSHLHVLLLHMLKWRVQSDRRSNSWHQSMENACEELGRMLDESPSLRREVEAALQAEFPSARRAAARETGIPIDRFPSVLPFDVALIEKMVNDAGPTEETLRSIAEG